MGQTHFTDDMPPQGQIECPEQILALLNSKQFDILYDSSYRGDDDRIIALMHMCESLCAAISSGQSKEGLENGVQMFDSALLVCLPAQEVRTIITTIIKRDTNLIHQMPQMRKMLWRVYRAAELSVILAPDVLERIAADVMNQNKWGAA